MQLDPKGKLAARRAYETEMSKRVAWHADGGPDDTPMDCAIRAYLEAAPSPSPAPGVVEALHDLYETSRKIGHKAFRTTDEFDAHVDACAAAYTALASLSQPAKGELEGGGL